MADEKKEEAAPCCKADNIVFFWAIGGLVFGLMIGYLVFPGMAAAPATGGNASAAGGGASTAFVLDMAKVNAIASLLETNIYLSSGMEMDVAYQRYVDKGAYVELYYGIGGDEMPIYISRDYRYIYPSGALEVSAIQSQMDAARAQAAQQEAAEAAGIPKSAEPEVLMFVMSYCPYGNQAEAGLVPVIDLLADKAAFEPVYIIYNSGGECVENGGKSYCALHGNAELWQNVREKIIFNLYGERKWAEYVDAANSQCTLSNIDTCWEAAAGSAGVDKAAVVAEFDANKFAIMDSEMAKTTMYRVSGSPTILINGYTYNGARSPEAYKAKVCEAYTVEPAECAAGLSTSGAAATGSC